MTPAEIRFRIDSRDLTQRDLAKAAQCSEGMVSLTISGARTSPKVRRAIADRIGASYVEVWGTPDPEGLTPGANEVKNFTQALTPDQPAPAHTFSRPRRRSARV